MNKATKNRITMYEPNPSAFEVQRYSTEEKAKLISYMQSFEPYAAAGRIFDCVTGEHIKKEDVGYTDGEFMWTSQDIYHIEKYNAAVTNAFFKKAVDNLGLD